MLDLRLLPVAAALWAGTLAGLHMSTRYALVLCGVLCALAIGVLMSGRSPRARQTLLAMAMACIVVGLLAGVSRAVHVRQGPVAQLAEQEAFTRVKGVVTADPQLRRRTSGPAESAAASRYVLVKLQIDEITGRGITAGVRTPVFAMTNDLSWMDVRPGQRFRSAGRLSPADGGDVAAFLRIRGAPELVGPPSVVARMTEPPRAALREAVAAVPQPQRGLIPGMVVGDESLMTEELREQMRATGLAHLTAVSGANVSIVLLAVIGAARVVGIRGYVLPAVAVLGLVGFVFLARPDPSVLRAAVMGAVAVAGILVAGRRRALPALCAAVAGLVLVDPWLAGSLGFTLSVLATAGIIALVPAWERAVGWLPRPLALAIAVPLSAQVACTPVLLAAFGQLSVASLPANMLVAPAVPPLTVLGLMVTSVGTLLPVPAAWLAWLTGFPAWWIATVARWLAEQPGSEIQWPTGAVGAAIGIGLGVLALALVPLVLRRPVVTAAVATCLAVVLLRAWPTPGWPPAGWLMAMCDVGQGDAIVLRAGPHSAVVVDAGPEPPLVRRCLDSLDIRQVPLLVLTHYHADHVNGLPGVLAGREVRLAVVSPLNDPVSGAQKTAAHLAEAGVSTEVARAGGRWHVGASVSLEVLWPRRVTMSPSESDSNNASVVMAADIRGVSALLTGDIEPLAQRALLRAEPALSARVLKVAHHGSAHQDERLLTAVGAELALIGVGENTHGHPAPEVLELLRDAGVDVRRTDLHGTVAVIRRDDGTLTTATTR